MCTVTTIHDKIMCMVWQYNNTAYFMNTAHSIASTYDSWMKTIECRNNVYNVTGVEQYSSRM